MNSQIGIERVLNALSGMGNFIVDVWYVGILRMHKHRFEHTEDTPGPKGAKCPDRRQISHPLSVCPCGKRTRIDAWQIASMPASMRYERLS